MQGSQQGSFRKKDFGKELFFKKEGVLMKASLFFDFLTQNSRFLDHSTFERKRILLVENSDWL